MTRREIEDTYEVRDGIIQSLGKFEAEAVYAPYFYAVYLDGCADDDDGEVLTFTVEPEDIEQFPELAGRTQVKFYEGDQGFFTELDC
jgi:hypothetical protein